MASAKQQENMLLTEHFSWPPISLIDDIINAVNEVLYRCTDSFETGLSSADPALLGFADLYASQSREPQKDKDGNNEYPEARLEIEEGVLKLETLMENAVDKNFDKLEIWTLRNVFALGRGKGEDEGLGDWVRLGHYENLQPPSQDANLTPEALFSLRRKLVETQKLHAALVAEKTRNEALIAQLRTLLTPQSVLQKQKTTLTTEETASPFAFLTHTPSAQALGLTAPSSSASSSSSTSDKPKAAPLTTHTTFSTTQLASLRQLVGSLKPHVASTLTLTSTSSWAPASTQHEQRRAYIEGRAKRVLERRGVDTVDGVEGVWEIGGTRVGGDEVRGLEALVARRINEEKKKKKKKRMMMKGVEEEGDNMDTT